MSQDLRDQVRQRIADRLRGDEWMERHFGIAAHADDVADAVMELFTDVVGDSPWMRPGYVIMRVVEKET